MLLLNKRIFVVEDNLENRIVIEMLLKEAGAVSAFDRWGKQTLTRLHDFAPVDLILLDLMLPKGITGFDIFDLIRAEAAFATVPIVAVSATDSSTAIPKTKAKGFAGFISKPLKFTEFSRQIATILNGEQIWER